MNPCERFGIRYFSNAQISLWRINPGLWGLRYIADYKDETIHPDWMRGKAVENGLEFLLRSWKHEKVCELAAEHALKNFDLNVLGADPEQTGPERELIAPMLETIRKKWTPPGPLQATQLRCEYYFDPIPVPIIGYIDFGFDGLDVDLKTTKACPSKPRPADMRQVALYRAARRREGGLLYVTHAKCAYYPVFNPEAEIALEELRADAVSLYKFLGKFNTRREILESLPIDWDNFRAPKTKVSLEDILFAG